MRAILNGALHERTDPSRRQVEGDFQPEELRFPAPRKHRAVRDAVQRAQRGAGAEEEDLLDPELRAVLVSDRNVPVDAQRAPDDARDVDGKEGIGPRLDLDPGVRESEHPGKASHGREDDRREGPGGVFAVGLAQPESFSEQQGDD